MKTVFAAAAIVIALFVVLVSGTPAQAFRAPANPHDAGHPSVSDPHDAGHASVANPHDAGHASVANPHDAGHQGR